jgi:hypothetical protein
MVCFILEEKLKICPPPFAEPAKAGYARLVQTRGERKRMQRIAQISSKIIVVTALTLSPIANAALDYTAIQRQPDFDPPLLAPHIELIKDRLVVAQNWEKKLNVYDVSQSETRSVLATAGTFGNIGFASHASSGWVSLCRSAGQGLTTFNVLQPERRIQYEFPTTAMLSCFGLAFDGTARSGIPTLWIGSASDRRVVQIDARSAEILRTYSPVSGPFNLEKAGRFLFGANGLTQPGASLPWVIDTLSGRTVAGHLMGDITQTTLRREYNSEMVTDLDRRSVYYLSPQNSKILRFDTTAPHEQTAQTIALNAQFPRAVTPYGSCLVVLDQIRLENEAYSLPAWVVLKQQPSGDWMEVRRTERLGVLELKGAFRQRVDRGGRVYIAHWTGVTQVRGVLDGVDCTGGVR